MALFNSNFQVVSQNGISVSSMESGGIARAEHRYLGGAVSMAFAADIEQGGIEAADASTGTPAEEKANPGDLTDSPASTEPDASDPGELSLLPLTPLVSLEPLADYTIDLSGSVSNGTGYTWNMTDKIITFTTAANGNSYRIIQTGGTQNVLGIVVGNGVNTTIAIQNINLQTVSSPISIEGNAKLALQLVGTNTLKATSTSSASGAINAGVSVPSAATLIISGTGSLNVTSGRDAAGIGGNDGTGSGNITINSGTVTAKGDGGAGIGGGFRGAANAITINGGTVTAKGDGGAGIGGGSGGSGETIVISGGTVTATGDGAGIGGGGQNCLGGTITISGGTIIASGYYGAGIGNGVFGSGGTITINNGNVTAKGNAGIGGGYSSTIIINGGTVMATGVNNGGNFYGAGIGCSNNGSGAIITISGGSVIANGGSGAGIGGGSYSVGYSYGSGGTTIISGGTVTATGRGGGAGRVGGDGGLGGIISIENNASVIATGSYSLDAYGRVSGVGAGIGGGSDKINDPATSVSIDSTANVKAYAGSSTIPAIDAYYGNSGNGYYVSGYLDTATSTERSLAIYPNGSASSTNSLNLPANYQSFAYTTGSTTQQNDRIYAYNSANGSYLGRAERVYDSSPDISSTLNAAPTALKLNPDSSLNPGPAPANQKLYPFSGQNRNHTAALIAKEAYPTGAQGVIIANGEGQGKSGKFPDALAASALSGLLDYPILLTAPGSLPQDTIAALKDLKPSRIVVLGAENTISRSVATALQSYGQVQRIWGNNRIETAVEIYKYGLMQKPGGWAKTAIFADASNFPDALSIAPLASYKKIPVFLVSGNTLPAAVRAVFTKQNFTDAIIVGDANAVSTPIASQIKSILGKDLIRLGGKDRYDTSVRIASYLVSSQGMQFDSAGIATAQNFPDALAGAALLGKRGAVMLLADYSAQAKNLSTIDLLAGAKGSVQKIHIFGGTPAVSQQVRDYAAKQLGWV